MHILTITCKFIYQKPKSSVVWVGDGRPDMTSLFFSKVVKYQKSGPGETYLLMWKIRRVYELTVRPTKIMPLVLCAFNNSKSI